MQVNQRLYSFQYSWLDKDYLKYLLEYHYCMQCETFYCDNFYIFTVKKDKQKYLRSMCGDCKTQAVREKYSKDEDGILDPGFSPKNDYKRNLSYLAYRSFLLTDEKKYKKLRIICELYKNRDQRFFDLVSDIFK